MTLKQVFLRYLKEIGLYSELLNWLIATNGIENSAKYIKKINVNNLFYLVECVSRSVRGHWAYQNRTLYEFINDWCSNKNLLEIKRGDTITVKTQDGKYEFDYTVADFWLSKMEVQLVGGGSIALERITKVNGKHFNAIDGWELKKEMPSILKAHM